MALPKVENVAKRWRTVACLLWSTITCSLALYVAWKLFFLVTKGPSVEFSEQPGFGALPDFCLASWPPHHANLTFAFYEFHLAAGMNISNNRSLVRATVDTTANKICFQTSVLRLPAFEEIRKRYPDRAPLPKLSMAVLYHSDAHAAIVRGLYLTAVDVATNRSRDVGSIDSADEGSLGDGFFDTSLLEIKKERIVWRMTAETFTYHGFAKGLAISEESYRFTRLGKNRQSHVNCSYMTANRDHGWAGPDVPVDDHFVFGALPDATRASIGAGPCSKNLKMAHVVVKFPEDVVSIKEYIGTPLQIFRFCGSIGGLITIGTTLFFSFFVRKNEKSNIVQVYDELTFVMDDRGDDDAQKAFLDSIQAEEHLESGGETSNP